MIISYLQILERRIKEDLDSDEKEFLNFSVDGAKRMKGLLDAILQYSRINRFKQPFTEINLLEPIDAAKQNLLMAIKSSKAEIVIDEMPRIKADAIQMIQLFQNLIGNAIKFVEGKQPVVAIRVQEDGPDKILVSVSDNGIGIEERYKERIFDIFQRLHPKNQYEGSGIGLAICKTIVDRHGGKIWLESEVGKGTTFHFTLQRDPGYRENGQPQAQTNSE
jgi:light-regulated signal transduction histidine kinase (bacteriophytochrome)